MANIGKLTAHIGADTKGLVTGLTAGKRALSGFAGMATKALAPIAALVIGTGGIMALVSVMKDATDAGTSFEKTMATVGGVMRATASEQRNLTAAARKMGEITEYSATQAAESLQFLGMAGFEADKAIAALPGTLDLATAGQLDLGRAADIATNALTAMGLEVEELGRVNDVFVGTITRSNTNMDMLAESFRYAAPLARAYGYSIEELSGLIGMLGNAGIQGSMAGTQLAMSMLKANAIAKEFGFTSSDVIDVLDDMRKAGFTAGEVIAKFGPRAGRAMGVLFEATDAARAFQERLGLVAGEAKKLADTMRDTMWGIRKELTSVVESLKLDMYKQWQNELKSVFESTIGWIRENKSEIVVFTEQAVAGISAVVQLLKWGADWLKIWYEYISRFIPLLQPLRVIADIFPDPSVTAETLAAFKDIMATIDESDTRIWERFWKDVEAGMTQAKLAAIAWSRTAESVFGPVSMTGIGTALIDPFRTIHQPKPVIGDAEAKAAEQLASASTRIAEMMKDASIFTAQFQEGMQELVDNGEELGRIIDEEVLQNISAMGRNIEPFAVGMQQQMEELRDDMENVGRWMVDWSAEIANSMAAAFDNLFFNVLTGQLVTLKDFLTSFLRSIAQIISQTLARSFVEDIISILPSGGGGGVPVFDLPTPALQHGGLVTQPTLAMVGEAGPEVVIPLDRLDQVSSSRDEERPINVTVNINTPDVASFKNSASQIAAQMSATMSAARRNM